MLHDLHTSTQPRVILGLRAQDPLPEWITHVAIVEDGKVNTGLKNKVSARQQSKPLKDPLVKRRIGKPLVEMKGVKVHYDERKVSLARHWSFPRL